MKKNFCLDVLIFISGLICIVTGICLDFHIFPRGDMEIFRLMRKIHTYSGYIMAVGLIFHIAWHGNWIKSAAKQIFKK
jgi:hypothetical protein